MKRLFTKKSIWVVRNKISIKVFRKYLKRSILFQVAFLQECGIDNVCNPEVSISNPRLIFARYVLSFEVFFILYKQKSKYKSYPQIISLASMFFTCKTKYRKTDNNEPSLYFEIVLKVLVITEGQGTFIKFFI